MRRNSCLVVLIAVGISSSAIPAAADVFGSGANSFEVEFVTIGDPANAADTTGDPNPAGSVLYDYRMGKYEISRAMIEKANAAGGLELTLDPMAFVPGGPRPAMPATGVTWFEAARFVNWLNTSSGSSPAYKFNTQPGEPGYDFDASIQLWVGGDAGFDAANPFRNSQAKYFLPSVDEWYKAAYHDPNANLGAGGYWDYPTGSDSPPIPVASGTVTGTAVYSQPIGAIADVTLAGGLSPHGVMGLGGNVFEWEETELDLVNDAVSASRGLRGGDSNFGANFLIASNRQEGGPAGGQPPAGGSPNLGFRVASTSSLSGDYDGDGEVDGADLARWKASFGVDGGADGDEDDDSDGNDFLIWQRNLGTDLNAGPTTAAVPEPATLVLLMLAAAGTYIRRHRTGNGPPRTR